MSNNERVVIIGAGGQAKIYTEIMELLEINLIGYVSCEPKGTIINGYEVLCDIDTFVDNCNEINANSIIVSIGDNIIRNSIYSKIKFLGLNNINIIHPSAIISKDVNLGEGIYIGAGVVINPGTIIDSYVTIGANATIEHECIINKYVNIAPGVCIAGKASMGSFSVAAIGSTIIEKVKIGNNSIIGANSLVLKDIPKGVVAFGLPAKVIRKRELNKTYLK